MAKLSVPSRPRLSQFSCGMKFNGSTPMPTRLERWIRSKLSAITARTPRRAGPFAAQSRELPVPYSFPASTTRGSMRSRNPVWFSQPTVQIWPSCPVSSGEEMS